MKPHKFLEHTQKLGKKDVDSFNSCQSFKKKESVI